MTSAAESVGETVGEAAGEFAVDAGEFVAGAGFDLGGIVMSGLFGI